MVSSTEAYVVELQDEQNNQSEYFIALEKPTKNTRLIATDGTETTLQSEVAHFKGEDYWHTVATHVSDVPEQVREKFSEAAVIKSVDRVLDGDLQWDCPECGEPLIGRDQLEKAAARGGLRLLEALIEAIQDGQVGETDSVSFIVAVLSVATSVSYAVGDELAAELDQGTDDNGDDTIVCGQNGCELDFATSNLTAYLL